MWRVAVATRFFIAYMAVTGSSAMRYTFLSCALRSPRASIIKVKLYARACDFYYIYAIIGAYTAKLERL
jgi:hypothetical protein